MSHSERLRITYTTTVEGVPRERELPLVIGVMADLPGDPHPALTRLFDRQFVLIHRDNFDEVLAGFWPRLAIRVEDEDIELKFQKMWDFSPGGVALHLRNLRLLQILRNGSLASMDELDSWVHRLLHPILHAPEFQRLEATWRGLHYLVTQTSLSRDTKIKVLNISKKELYKDLVRAPEISRSIIFKKVHDDVYGVLGGEPLAALIGDYEFGNGATDVEILQGISQVAAAVHAPFIAAVSPSLFDRDSFEEVMRIPSLRPVFEGPDRYSSASIPAAYAKWQSFRRSADARYVGLTLPRIRLRAPYWQSLQSAESYKFEEEASGGSRCFQLWGNAAYAFATRLADSFARFGWCAAIQGADGGGLAEGLPSLRIYNDAVDFATEVRIPDSDEEFSRLGFIPLCIQTFGNELGRPVFPLAPSTQAAGDSDFERAAAQLPYVFAGARFAHYVKVIVSERASSFCSAEECENFLNEWLRQYDIAYQEERTRLRPLSGSRITVSRTSAGYIARLRWLPAFQLPPLTIQLAEDIILPQIGHGSF